MELDCEETSSDFKAKSMRESETSSIDLPQHSQETSKCRWLYVVGYLGVFYFVIVAIIYILIQYTLIYKYEQDLICDDITNTCNATIDHVEIKNQIYFQLASDFPNYLISYPVGIDNITLSNSTKDFKLSLFIDEEPNAYFYYRHLWAIDNVNILYSFNISFHFSNQIPAPFFNDLRVIMREAGMFDQDQTISQAIVSLFFAACIAFFNISSKFTSNYVKQKPRRQETVLLHKIAIQPPKDIEEIDKTLQNLRETALLWMMKRARKSLEFYDSDSQFEWEE